METEIISLFSYQIPTEWIYHNIDRSYPPERLNVQFFLLAPHKDAYKTPFSRYRNFRISCPITYFLLLKSRPLYASSQNQHNNRAVFLKEKINPLHSTRNPIVVLDMYTIA